MTSRKLAVEVKIGSVPVGQMSLVQLDNVFSSPKGKRRYKRSTADLALLWLVRRLESQHLRQDFMYWADVAFVFGSYLTPSKTVGDLDVAVRLRSKYEDWEPGARRFMENARTDMERPGLPALDRVEWQRTKVLRYLRGHRQILSICDITDCAGVLRHVKRHTIFGSSQVIAEALAASEEQDLEA